MAVEQLYAAHWRQLVRLSVLLVHDQAAAEDVVQDAFVAMHGRWSRLRDPDNALAYLRQAVVNRSRSALRRRRTAEAYVPESRRDVASAEEGVLEVLENARVMAALGRLPRRQREVLVLRYYADLSEADIAEVLGIAPGTVKSRAARALRALALDESLRSH